MGKSCSCNFFQSDTTSRSFSRQSTPKRVSFRKLIENGKAKTAQYLPFHKYIQNYKEKKKFNDYSPIKGKMQVTTKVMASLLEPVSGMSFIFHPQ